MPDRSPIIMKLLERRGVTSEEDVAEFFASRPKRTYDPMLLPDMEKGVSMILSAVEEGRRICIYGDYDCDGITSIGILLSILRELTDQVEYYIPSRVDEGYGLNRDAMETIAGRDVSLIVTVDCGTTSTDEVAYARELGMEILVTDHHGIGETLPDCPVINPKRADSQYPFDGLAGCGVAYKLAQAIQRRADLPRERILRVLDLVAIGTVGDIVPLVDENRTLVKYGLAEIRSGHRESLRIFLEGIGLSPETVTAEQISFGIAPHLNAAGRMASAEDGLKLLLAGDRNQAMLYTEVLKGYNHKRKEEQERTYENCLLQMEEQCGDSLFPVIEAEDAHEGIAGIVAGKIKDREKKPVIIVTPTEGDLLKGTGRCIAELNLFDLLKGHGELFERFGGHQGACGFLMKKENLKALRDGLQADLLAMDPTARKAKIPWELDLTVETVDLNLAEELEAMAPFGNANPRPLFRWQDAAVSQVRRMGAREQHMRFRMARAGTDLYCVLFSRAADYGELIQEGERRTVYGELNINQWKGNRNLQVLVRDVE